jgi:chorismate mutase
MTNDLKILRNKIDGMDSKIISLLKKRLDLVTEVGKLKKKNNLKPLDKKRWGQVLNTVEDKAKNQNLSQTLVKKIWNLIHEEALKIEKSL